MTFFELFYLRQQLHGRTDHIQTFDNHLLVARGQSEREDVRGAAQRHRMQIDLQMRFALFYIR